MKNLFILFFISLTIFVNAQTQTLKGTVTDDTGEVVMFANVAIYQNGKLIVGTQTDIDGKYQLDSLAAGTYDVEVSYMSYENKKITDVVLFYGKSIRLNIEISEESQIIDCPGFYYYPALYDAENLTQGTIFFSKEIQRSPHKN